MVALGPACGYLTGFFFHRFSTILFEVCMRFFMMVFFILLGSFAAAAGPGNLTKKGETGSAVRVALLPEYETMHPGQTAKLAIRFRIRSGWHIYWHNPGDSGLPTKVVLTLPEGWRHGPLLFPAPKRVVEGGIVNYAYSDEVWVVCLVTAPEKAPSKAVKVTAKMDWLECESACIPGSAEVKTYINVAKKEKLAEPYGKGFELGQKAMPVNGAPTWGATAGAKGRVVNLTLSGDGVKLTPGAKIDFFPLDGSIFTSAVTAKVSGGRRVEFQLPLADGAPVPPVVRGVAVSDKGWGIKNGAEALSVETELGKPKALGGFALMILWAFLGGMILNLMPCVFPVLSIKVLSFARQGGGNPKAVRQQGLVYVGGVVLSFLAVAGLLMALKAGGTALGWGFQLQSPLFVLAMTAMIFLVGLNLLGVFEIGTSLTGAGAELTYKPGLAGAFWSGVLAVVIASPCTAPFMGAALGYALSQPWYVALIIFLFLGFGMGLPYLVLSLNTGLLARLPKPGAWMNTFKQIMAFPMFATMLWLAWVFGRQTGVDGMLSLFGALLVLSLAAWVYGKWSLPHLKTGVKWMARLCALALLVLAAYLGYTGTKLKAPTQTPVAVNAGTLAWQNWSPERVKELEAAGKPYFVDFTAAWCLTCQVNKKTTLASKKVEGAFRAKGITLLRADWTDYNPQITKALAQLGRAGVPVYLYDNGTKGREPEVLPEILTEGLVLEALGR